VRRCSKDEQNSGVCALGWEISKVSAKDEQNGGVCTLSREISKLSAAKVG
jgi:hypothetical protein